MTRHTVSSLSLLLVLAAGGAAQTPPTFTDSVVVTATGDAADAADVCAAVTVIDRAQIDATGHAAAAELLRAVPGATLLRSGLDGSVTSLFVRGTSSSQTLVLFDGVRLNSPFFGGYDWSLPMTAGLERIEIVRGPYSSLYGGDAVGGVVQLIPRRVRGTDVHATVEAGSQGWRRAEAEATVSSGGWSLLASAAQRDGSGPLANDDFSTRSGLLDLGYRLSERSRLGVLARSVAERTEIPFSGPRTTPHRRTEAEETLVALPLRVAIGPDAQLDVTLSHVARRLRFRDPDDPFGFVASDTRADSDSGTTSVHARFGPHWLVGGAEWRRDEVTDGSSFGVNLSHRALTTRALFLQDHAAIGEGFSVQAGLRWDEAPPWGRQVSPRVTLGWARGEVRTWVAQGRAFRAPGLGDLYYPYSGNPDLRPERSRSLESGVRVLLAADGSFVEVVAFRNRIDDLIDFDYVAQRSANIARASQDGVELSWAGATTWGRTRASLTWLDAEDGAGGRLLRRPEWSSSVTWYGDLGRHVDGAFELLWVGARPDLDPVTLQRVALGGFVTANAAAAVPVSRALAIRVRLENVAGRRYEEVRGYPAAGRRAMLGVELR